MMFQLNILLPINPQRGGRGGEREGGERRREGEGREEEEGRGGEEGKMGGEEI